MTSSLVAAVVALTVMAQSPTGAQSDWARVAQLAANAEVTVATGATTIAGRVVSADQTGLTLKLGSGATTRFDRASIQEVRRVTKRRGSKLGAAIGAGAAGFLGVGLAIGLATKDCGGDCTDEKIGMGVALVGLPIGGGLAGYYLWPPKTSVDVIYTRPML